LYGALARRRVAECGAPGVLAISFLVLGYATVVQAGGENQFAHLALVRALADGTPIVDPYHKTKDLLCPTATTTRQKRRC
jgi:hypothetical protein